MHAPAHRLDDGLETQAARVEVLDRFAPNLNMQHAAPTWQAHSTEQRTESKCAKSMSAQSVRMCHAPLACGGSRRESR
jgi:hypothetical protein